MTATSALASKSWPASPTAADLVNPKWLTSYSVAEHLARSAGAAAMFRPASVMKAASPLEKFEAARRIAQDQALLQQRMTGWSAAGSIADTTLGAAATAAEQALAPNRLADQALASSRLAEQALASTRAAEAMAAPLAALDRAVRASKAVEHYLPADGLTKSERKVHSALDRMDRIDRMIAGTAPTEHLIERVAPIVPITPVRPLQVVPSSDAVVEEMQAEAREWMAVHAPLALQRIEGAHDALRRGDPESLAQAATSCRRAIVALTDVLYAPSSIKVRDRSGKWRTVDRDAWKNRLVLHIEETKLSRSGRRLTIAEMEALLTRLDRLAEASSSGVHDEIAYDAARRVYFATWTLIADVIPLRPRRARG